MSLRLAPAFALGLALALAPRPAAAAAEASGPTDVIDAPPRPLSYHLTLTVAGVFTCREALGQVLWGGGPDLRLGAEHRSFGIGLHAAFERGQVSFGLPYEVTLAGLDLWWRPGSGVSVGFGFDLGTLAVLRVTRDARLWTVLVDGHGTLQVHLGPRTRAGTFVLLVRVALELLTDAPGVPVTSFATTIGLGWRGGANGRWP